MSYRHLPYEKYFLDTSRDYNSTGRATCGVEYVSVPYRTGGLSKLFGIEHEANYAVLYDGERGGHDSDEFRCYRVLAILNERACIIDSKTQMHYGEFISALEKLGVRYALYCDMGSGWNYSWYRDENGRAVDIIGTPWPFSHNWLVFK